MDELVFKPHITTISNLNKLTEDGSKLGELRMLEIDDIAENAIDICEELNKNDLTIYEQLSFLFDGMIFSEYPCHSDALQQSERTLSSYKDILSNLDKITFCDLFIKGYEKRIKKIRETDFLQSQPTEETFTYVKNGFSDEAFDVFSQEFKEPKVKYSSTFQECINSVRDGKTSYCLLPLEEKGGSRLPTVAELIYRSDLKVNSVTPVFGYDGNADLKYALISKGFNVPKAEKDDDRYLEIRIESDGEMNLSDLMMAANYFDMTVYRVNTVTFDLGLENKTYFCIVFRDEGGEFTPLLTYLTLFAPDFMPVGVYKNLE